MRLVVEFGGGLELLFDKVKRMELDIPVVPSDAAAPPAAGVPPEAATAASDGTPAATPAAAAAAGTGAASSGDAVASALAPPPGDAAASALAPPPASLAGAGGSGGGETLPAVVAPFTVAKLLAWVRDNLLKERPELFMAGDTLRPGVLCLINDADWELEGKLEYVLQAGDNVVFVSTLHGG